MGTKATQAVGGQKTNSWKELGQVEQRFSARRKEWASVVPPFRWCQRGVRRQACSHTRGSSFSILSGSCPGPWGWVGSG